MSKPSQLPKGYKVSEKNTQECIPVGCVPPTAVVMGGLVLIPLNFPLGCWPGPDPQFPPWMLAWT